MKIRPIRSFHSVIFSVTWIKVTYLTKEQVSGWFPWQRSSNVSIPDSKVHGANMWPTWVLSAPDGPRVGPMYLAFRNVMTLSWAIPISCAAFSHRLLHLLCGSEGPHHSLHPTLGRPLLVLAGSDGSLRLYMLEILVDIHDLPEMNEWMNDGGLNRWVSARKTQLQCVSNVVTFFCTDPLQVLCRRTANKYPASTQVTKKIESPHVISV